MGMRRRKQSGEGEETFKSGLPKTDLVLPFAYLQRKLRLPIVCRLGQEALSMSKVGFSIFPPPPSLRASLMALTYAGPAASAFLSQCAARTQREFQASLLCPCDKS